MNANYHEPKFQPGEKVMVGEYPFNREGTIAAFGPFKEGEHNYFVSTNLGEVCYPERLVERIAP
jgi:hypothetical protein